MISLTAHIRTRKSDAYLVPIIGESLRQYDHVVATDNQIIVLLPGVGSVLVTQSDRELTLNVVMRDESAAAAARSAAIAAVTKGAGGHAAATLVTISWSREETIPALLR